MWDNHHILNLGKPVKSGGAVLGSGLALLGIVVMIEIVVEDCKGLTMSTVDHFPLINAGWPVGKTSVMAPRDNLRPRARAAGG